MLKRKTTALVLAMALTITALPGQMLYAQESSDEIVATAAEETLVPKQVNTHFGSNASTQMNITYTTVAETTAQVSYHAVGDSKKLETTGTTEQGNANKYFHAISLKDLQAGTEYEYTVGKGENSYTGKFKTALKSGSKQSFKFAYVADTQVSNATNAKALGANLQAIADGNYDFVYLAGDHTDTATNESQWEYLFNNNGAYPEGGQNMYGNNAVAVVQGNHDNSTLTRHINASAEAGNVVYSFDYGSATFVMLNLETAKSSSTARDEQEAYLRKIVANAKERGQWTLVGFHKSLYTGASHITDSDVVSARKFWAPIFADLDVDVVMQGHDHVYSRGFINEDGYKAIDAPTGSSVENPTNAPLYMVGGHAGGLKWYSKKSYTFGSDDPLSPNYSFLDVNSTDDNSDTKKEQWIVSMEIDEEAIQVTTSAFKYDTSSDTITKDSYVYDTLTVTRGTSETREAVASIAGPDIFVKEQDEALAYTISSTDIQGANTVSVKFSYDNTKLELEKVDSLLENTILNQKVDKDGNVTLYLGCSKAIAADQKEIAKLVFKTKKDYVAQSTTLSLKDLQFAVPDKDAQNSAEFTAEIKDGDIKTILHSYEKASDINQSGSVTLADLSLAFTDFQTDAARSDMNLDGIVDTADYVIIMQYIKN